MKRDFLRTGALLLMLVVTLIAVCPHDAFAGRWVLTGYGWKYFEYCAITPTYDTYVDNNNPNTSYGGQKDLYIGDARYNEPAKICRTYMMFNLNSVPAGKPIVAAKMNLRTWGVGSNPKIVGKTHYLPNNSWNESITWNTAPTGYNASATDTQTVASSANWYSWNVTSDAILARSGSGYLSEVLISSTEGTHQWAAFSSKEEYNSNFRPYLEVWYDPNGTIVPGGSEGYKTNSGNIQFGSGSALPSIPSGFFGPGSDPFEGQVALKSGTSGPTTDTTITRQPGKIREYDHTCTVPVEMVSLNLVSTSPITVTFGGIVESFFDVFVSLSAPPSTGQMTIQEDDGIDPDTFFDVYEAMGGGTYRYGSINTHLTLTFVNTNNPAEVYTLEIPGAIYPAPLMIEQTMMYKWQNTTRKENQPGGYDGFYPVGEDALGASLLYSGGTSGHLMWMPPQEVRPELMVDSEEDWLLALERGRVTPVTEEEWNSFISQYNMYVEPGNPPYPPTTFAEARLYVCGPGGGGGGGCYCEDKDAGLVMTWGNEGDPDGHYASAFKYAYPFDPDLTNCTVTTTVYPPSRILIVSLGLEDVNGNIRAWYWNVAQPGSVPPYPVGTIPFSPAPGPGPGAVPTTINIDLSKTGVNAAIPTAASYASNPAFDLSNVTDFKFDEDSNFVADTQVPPPGSGIKASWNYWKDLLVTQNTPPVFDSGLGVSSKYHIKWSQRPDIIDSNNPKLIRGWDQQSVYYRRSIVADDWKCTDDRPVTDIHWWGSYVGWTKPYPPQVVPKAFHIGIWTDTPAGTDPAYPFSHPRYLIWENYCTNWVWNFFGYDVPPDTGHGEDPNFYEKEACFQFNQLLSEDEWFYQEPNSPWDNDPCSTIYWLSISAIYDPNDKVQNPWGWKTRRPEWNDDAVVIWDVNMPLVDYPPGLPPPPSWPPTLGAEWKAGMPIEYPMQVSWDVAFELTTNRPDHNMPASPDLNYDGIVNFLDFAIFAEKWLTGG